VQPYLWLKNESSLSERSRFLALILLSKYNKVMNGSLSGDLLQTKLYVPRLRPSLIPRPHLIQKLNRGLHRKLTLISAPAGFGKTTLITEWIAGCERPFAWLSLDERDSDLTRFLQYLIAALQTLNSAIGTKTSALLTSGQPPTESTLTTLLNEITAVPQEFALVLDDYHMLDAPPIDQALTFLLDHLPPQMHLVITTREDPSLPLSRLRVRGQLTELRASDLRFTVEETAVFLNQMMGLNLSEENITALETRTEGWIAGLQMAALSMQGQKDITHFIQSFSGSHHFVLDYLVEEVLQQQPENVQDFLLQTAVLDQLTASLCNALTGEGNGQKILELLERANLFLIPLDNERRWYRYHHLFADLLRQRLQQSTEADDIAALHIRASQWYEANGLENKAIHHAFAAKDFEQAARLIELVWPEMDGTFQTATWLEWADALPADLFRTRPALTVYYAWAYLNNGNLEAAEAQLQEAERLLDKTTDGSQEIVIVDKERLHTLRGSIASARTYHAQALGDNAKTMKYAQQALDLLPEDDYINRGPAASLLALMYWAEGKLEAAYQYLAEAMNGFKLAGQMTFAISGTYGLADIKIAQGHLREAVKIYERSLQLAQEQEETSIRGTTDLYWGLGMLHHEQGHVEIAKHCFSKSEALGEQMALPDWPHRRNRALAQMKAAQGSFAEALDLLDEAERLYFRGPVPDIRPIAALRAQVWVKQGRLTAAREWAREQEISIDDDLSYLREFEHLTFVRLLIAEYKSNQTEQAISDATQLLKRLLKAAEAGQRMESVLVILVIQALAYEAQNDIASACKPLERALTIAKPEGYVRLFVDEGSPMARLLYEALARGIEPETVHQLLAAFPAADSEPPPSPPPTAVESGLFEPLSEREIEVLQFIAEGLTNQEVANQLYLSLHTVKVHARNIYGKLDVKNRTEAVAKARALGIF